MEMSTKTKLIAGSSLLIVAFSLGRYSAPKIPTVHTESDTKIDQTTQIDKNTHKVTTITEDCKTGKKVTTITEDTNTQARKDKDTNISVTQTITPPKTSLINISGLASLDTSRGFTPVYGISASKEFIGPITLGAFGLTNGTIGLSIGVNF